MKAVSLRFLRTTVPAAREALGVKRRAGPPTAAVVGQADAVEAPEGLRTALRRAEREDPVATVILQAPGVHQGHRTKAPHKPALPARAEPSAGEDVRRRFALAWAAFVVAAPMVMAQTIPDSSWLGNEPNVPSSGRLPYPPLDGDTQDYRADANGMDDARRGDAVRILGVSALVGVEGRAFDVNTLLASFAGGAFLLPGPQRFEAWLGTWADHDGDGTIDRVGDVEWSPGYGEVVGYLTPLTPTSTQPGNTLFMRPGGDPDLRFERGDGGRYTVAGGFDLLFVDNSMLETTVSEVFDSPVASTGTWRTMIPSESSRIDVDLYKAVDPTVEALYREIVVAPIVGAGCDVDHPENSALDFVTGDRCPDGNPVGPAARDALTTLGIDPQDADADSSVGAVFAPVLPPYPMEVSGYDHAFESHPYFDLRLQYAVHNAAQDYPAHLIGAPSHAASGAAEAPLFAGVYGRLGVWQDANGDGFIGAPQGNERCDPAPYHCGHPLYRDPNDYESSEWLGLCRQGDAGHTVNVTLRPDTPGARWGSAGVYVWTADYHEGAAFGGTPDVLRDSVVDGTDARLDRLVLAGPVKMHLTCGWLYDPGQYTSYEHLVFPSSNIGFGIVLASESVGVRFMRDGILVEEFVQDVDVVPAWASR